MNIRELEAKLNEITRKFVDFAQYEAPEVIGQMAQEFYKKSFENEGFTDASFEEWKEVKRRQSPKRPDRADAQRKILTGTGNLRRSVDYDAYAGEVRVHAEAFSAKGFNYAPVHNWGTTRIPQRQFLGESHTLNKAILKRLKEKVNEINKGG